MDSTFFIIKLTIAALVISAVPALSSAFMPIWILIVFIYWQLRFNIKAPLIAALPIGLLFDVLYGNLLGQHALALMLSSFFIVKVQQSFSFSNITTEQVYIVGASSIYLLSSYVVYSIYILDFYTQWLLLLSPITTALSWSVIKWLLNKISPIHHSSNAFK